MRTPAATILLTVLRHPRSRPKQAGLTVLVLLLFLGLTSARARAEETTPTAASIRALSVGSGGSLRFEALVPPDQLYALQSSVDLVHWRRASSLSLAGQGAAFADLDAPADSQSFYRLAREETMFRFNPRHSGLCDTGGITGTNATLKWAFQTGDHVVASPAVVGGVVYVGSVDTNLYALDAATGAELWRFRTDGAIRSSATVANGRVYFSSRDGFLYALRAEGGQELWRCKIAETNQTASVDNWDYFDSSPTLVDGVIYIGSGDKTVRAIDASSGAVRWSFATQAKLRSTPAVVNGIVYVGGLDRYFYALDAVTGTNVWKYRVQGNSGFPMGEIFHAPVVDNGVVYFGSRDSTLYAVDAVAGTNRWRRPVCGGSSWVFNSPAVWKGLVLLGTSIPGYLIAVDLNTSREKWSLSLPAQEYSSPAIADGIAYFGTGDALSPCTTTAHPKAAPAYFYAVNLATGKQLWRYRTPGHVWSSPAVVDGSVYFGCLDGMVYALH